VIRGLLTAVVLALAGLPSGAQAADRVPVLLYHHVAEAPAGTSRALYVAPRLFARQMAALDRAGYTAVTLDRVWRAWRGGRALPRRPVVVSFDDGYANQHRSAAPVLRRLGWPGVLFLSMRFLDDDDGISSRQVRSLIGQGWAVDAHTLTHPDLTTLDGDAMRREIGGSRRAIREAFGVPANFFAYPFGRFDDAVAEAVRAAGFRAATTTRRGQATAQQDPYALPRIIVTGRTTPEALVRSLR
jgi:peptidoglycan/xylan/chitin deacetylase (PgdA/CDA1 family)